MPAQPTASVAVSYSFEGTASDQVINVFNVAKLGSTDPWDAPELVDLVDELGSLWSDTIGMVLSEDLNVDSIRAASIVTGGGFAVEKAPEEGTWANIGEGTAARPWECMLVQYSSTAPGRSGRGRTYLPGGRYNQLGDSGLWLDAYRNSVADALTAWRTDMETMTTAPPCVQVVYSRTNDSVATVTATAVRPLLGIQRDRRGGSL